ncbi:MAG: ABC transporter permease [Lachnospiraceae bacterium]|nr:ABC transporter permease [Lachnospiraceae bacterium]
MRGFIGFTKRNMMMYFKDLGAVFFSMLTSIIVFALYQLFLKGTFYDSISGAMEGLDNLVLKADLDTLINGVLLTGIMGSALITVPFNCLNTIVKDKEHRVDYDISATPLKRWQIILSYFTASSLSSIIMVAVILTIGLIALTTMGDTYITAKYVALLYGIVVVGAISSTAFFMVIMIFFKDTSVSSAFFGILSAAAGFVIGAYIPISQFSTTVQTVCNLFPASHITVLIRQFLLSGVVEHIDEGIGGIDGGAFAESIKNTFSFNAYLFGGTLSNVGSLIYAGALVIVCIGAMTVLYNKTYKRK